MKSASVESFLIGFLFQISNTSELSITYSLKLDSLSPLRHSRAQVLPRFLPPFNELPETQQHALGENVMYGLHATSCLKLSSLNLKMIFFLAGPSNYNGMAVFDCVPAQGIIGPGRKQDIFSKLPNKSFLVQWLSSVYVHGRLIFFLFFWCIIEYRRV